METVLRQVVTTIIFSTFGLAALTGCGKSYDELRPNPSDLSAQDSGLQSKDLIEMTDKMAPDLLKIPEIVQNPNKIVIVMTGIDNKTSNPTVDQTIYLARIRALLNERARDRLSFVENRATLQKLQGQELGNQDPFEQGSRGPGATGGPLVPQYALKGEFYDLPRASTNYYLCTFQLTNLRTGEVVWEGHYEVKTLNI